MVLTRENLEECLQGFPHIATRFRSVAEQRMTEVRRKISYRRKMEVKSKMDAVAGLQSTIHMYAPSIFLNALYYFHLIRTTRGNHN